MSNGNSVEQVGPCDTRTIKAATHYSQREDTAAYPDVESALSEVYAAFRCSECAAPDRWIRDSDGLRVIPEGQLSTEVLRTRLRDDERLRAVAFYGGSVFTAISLVRSGASKHSPR